MTTTEEITQLNASETLTVTEAYALVTRLVELIEQYVKDPEDRAAAVRELSKLLYSENGSCTSC